MLDLLADVKFVVHALAPLSPVESKKKCFKLCNLSLNNVICEIMQLCAKYLLIFTSFYISPALLEALDYTNSFKFTLEGISLKKVHEGGGGGGGVQSDPSSPPMTDYSSDLYLRSIETTWCLIGFHGNHNIINDVTSRPPSWIINFSDFFHSN